MKKIILFMLLILVIKLLIIGEKLIVFEDIAKPHYLHISDDRVYIVQESNIFVYDFDNFKFLFKFGREGQGPGELSKSVFYRNKLITTKKGVLFEGYDKVILFSNEGKFIWEKRKMPSVSQILPIGNKFVVRRIKTITKSKKEFNCISLYNRDIKPIKDLFCLESPQQNLANKMKINMLLDTPIFKVWEDRIYIEKSLKGFLIDVYDLNGEILYSIKSPYKNLKLTKNRKKQIIDRYKNDVLVKREGGWDHFSKINLLVYPDTFPAIQNFEIFDNKIYVQTYKQKEGKDEYWMIDLKGKLIKKIYLPQFPSESLLDSILGTKLNCIYKNIIYYLKENGEEEWELHHSLIK